MNLNPYHLMRIFYFLKFFNYFWEISKKYHTIISKGGNFSL